MKKKCLQYITTRILGGLFILSSLSAFADQGIRSSSETSGILYFVDEGWTGQWSYLCINNQCSPGEKIEGEWIRSATELVVGSTYSVQIKIQDDSLGQYISPLKNVVFSIARPTLSPTITPTLAPVITPTASPTATPTVAPVITPTPSPTITPTVAPVITPTTSPTVTPMVPAITPSPSSIGGINLTAALRTPIAGVQSQAPEYGFLFDLTDREIIFRFGESLSQQYISPSNTNPDLQMWCSNNQVKFYQSNFEPLEDRVLTGKVPENCEGEYWYFFRYKKKNPSTSDPGTIWEYTTLYFEDESDLASRVDPLNYLKVKDKIANWMRWSDPQGDEGLHEGFLDSTTHMSSVDQLSRFEVESIDDTNNELQFNFLYENVVFTRIGFIDRAHPSRVDRTPLWMHDGNCQLTGSTLAECSVSLDFAYGQILNFEQEGVFGSVTPITYTPLLPYVVGLGFNSAVGDPRLQSAGEAGITATFPSGNTVESLERNAIFAQHLLTLQHRDDVDAFLKGHHLFHGIPVDVFGGRHGETLIGRDSCGNCHFRDGRGSEIVDVPGIGPRIAPPTFGVGLLQYIEGRKAGFTWNGNVDTVREQIRIALINDHGVDPDSLPADELENINKYTEFLTVPNRYANAYDKEGVSEGDDLFTQISCDTCHQRIQKTRSDAPPAFRDLVLRPYTDMDIHDVNGGKFRTPPLWGLGHNLELLKRNDRETLFMHNGSAHSLEEAIELHSGDADHSRQKFQSLSRIEKDQLLRFLETL